MSVLCEVQKVCVAIQRHFLRQESVPESSLYLGQPACGVEARNSTHVLLAAGWGQCGTLVRSVRPGPRGGVEGGAGAVSGGLERLDRKAGLVTGSAQQGRRCKGPGAACCSRAGAHPQN